MSQEAIRIQCGGCGKGLGNPQKYAGRRINCPACKMPCQVHVSVEPPLQEVDDLLPQ